MGFIAIYNNLYIIFAIFSVSYLLCLFHRINADLAKIPTPPFKSYLAGNFGKQSMIAPHTDITARMEAGTPLTNQNAAGRHNFAVWLFRTQALRVTVPTVTGTTHTFFYVQSVEDQTKTSVSPPNFTNPDFFRIYSLNF